MKEVHVNHVLARPGLFGSQSLVMLGRLQAGGGGLADNKFGKGAKLFSFGMDLKCV